MFGNAVRLAGMGCFAGRCGADRHQHLWHGGTYPFTVPAGVSQITVETWAGGGAGGGVTGYGDEGAGGAGGQYARKIVAVIPGSSHSIVVGAGGVASTGNGGAGAIQPLMSRWWWPKAVQVAEPTMGRPAKGRRLVALAMSCTAAAMAGRTRVRPAVLAVGEPAVQAMAVMPQEPRREVGGRFMVETGVRVGQRRGRGLPEMYMAAAAVGPAQQDPLTMQAAPGRAGLSLLPIHLKTIPPQLCFPVRRKRSWKRKSPN